MVHCIYSSKRKALASIIALALAVAMAPILQVPAAMATSSDASLFVAYMAYYDVLKAAVDEYGVGLNEVELVDGWPGYRGVFYAELIDFENDGFPEMLIIYNEGEGDIEAHYSIYGYPGKLERYFQDASYAIGDGASWYGIGTTRNNKKYFIASSAGEVGGGDYFNGNYFDTFYAIENGRWEEVLKCSYTITRELSDESFSWTVNGAQVSEQAYMMSISNLGIANEQAFDLPHELNSATVNDILFELNPESNPLEGASPWAYDGITAALGKGFIPGEILGRYTDVISRAEFCRMAVRWVEYATGKNIDALLAEKGLSRNPGAFTDTNDPDIQAAFALGITNGTGVGIFSPEGQFTREQAATMVMNTCKAIGANVDDPPASGFNDIDAASDWAVNGISFVRANGIMQGTNLDPPLFSPQAFYTREQSIITFNNIDHRALPGR